jgi:anti-sigma regulatory factor (Ser/Thr protein kinase)
MATSQSTVQVGHRQLCVMPSLPTSAKAAREWSSQLMTGWGLADDLQADTLLGVSELVANAAVHASCTVIACEMVLLSGRVRIDVRECLTTTDTAVALSLVRPNELAERGRGLLLVEALSLSWGWTPPRAGSGNGSHAWALFGEPR